MNINILLIFVILIIISYCILFTLNKKKYNETFTDSYDVDYDPYDYQYASISNVIYKNNKVIKNDIKQILSNLPKGLPKKILDIGCGSGSYTNEFKNNNFKVIGMDRSSNMIKKANIENPSCEFINKDIINNNSIEDTYPYIYIGHNVLNLNTHDEIVKIIKNCKKIIDKNGCLICHISDNKEMDIFPREYSQFYKNNGNNKDIDKVSFTYFKKFRYDRWFSPKKNIPNKYYQYEKITLENNKERIKRTDLTILPKNKTIDIITKNGFKLHKVVDNRFKHQKDNIIIFVNKN
jgi:SAM-dependent methyltransferase